MVLTIFKKSSFVVSFSSKNWVVSLVYFGLPSYLTGWTDHRHGSSLKKIFMEFDSIVDKRRPLSRSYFSQVSGSSIKLEYTESFDYSFLQVKGYRVGIVIQSLRWGRGGPVSVHTLHFTYIKAHLALWKRVGPCGRWWWMTVHQHTREENSLIPIKIIKPKKSK